VLAGGDKIGATDKVQRQAPQPLPPPEPILADLDAVFSFGDDSFRPTGPMKYVYHAFAPQPDVITLQMIPLDIIGFANFTNAHKGREMQVSICGAPQASVEITRTIDDGYIVLEGEGDAQRFAPLIRDGCPGVPGEQGR